MNYAPTITARPDTPPKCCVRCKTPWFCGNTGCSCHLTPAQILARARQRVLAAKEAPDDRTE